MYELLISDCIAEEMPFPPLWQLVIGLNRQGKVGPKSPVVRVNGYTKVCLWGPEITLGSPC